MELALKKTVAIMWWIIVIIFAMLVIFLLFVYLIGLIDNKMKKW